jgi:hypothetical protein
MESSEMSVGDDQSQVPMDDIQ